MESIGKAVKKAEAKGMIDHAHWDTATCQWVACLSARCPLYISIRRYLRVS